MAFRIHTNTVRLHQYLEEIKNKKRRAARNIEIQSMTLMFRLYCLNEAHYQVNVPLRNSNCVSVFSPVPHGNRSHHLCGESHTIFFHISFHTYQLKKILFLFDLLLGPQMVHSKLKMQNICDLSAGCSRSRLTCNQFENFPKIFSITRRLFLSVNLKYLMCA